MSAVTIFFKCRIFWTDGAKSTVNLTQKQIDELKSLPVVKRITVIRETNKSLRKFLK